jgi:hypothetical protein
MSFATRLLRILLIVVLVTSGPGMAMPKPAGPAAASHAVVSDSGCHDHAGMAHTVSRNGDGMRGHPHHPADCSSASCHCACGNLLQALSGPGALLTVVTQRGHEFLPYARLHPDAVLAHLIRPPIG